MSCKAVEVFTTGAEVDTNADGRCVVNAAERRVSIDKHPPKTLAGQAPIHVRTNKLKSPTKLPSEVCQFVAISKSKWTLRVQAMLAADTIRFCNSKARCVTQAMPPQVLFVSSCLQRR